MSNSCNLLPFRCHVIYSYLSRKTDLDFQFRLAHMEYDFLTWLGHASFLIKSGKLSIFVDPFRIGEIEEKADIIFITHPHRDHFSEEDIQRISKADTYFVGPQEALEKISSNNLRVVRPGDRGEVLGIAY